MSWVLIPVILLAGFQPVPTGGDLAKGGFQDEGSGLTEGREFPFWSYALNLLIALLLVVGLIVLIAWFMRRTMGRRLSFGGAGVLQLVASVALGDRRFVSVLRVGERYFLVGITSAEINMLSELDPEEVQRYLKGAEPEGGGFARLLQRLRGGGRESVE